MPPLRHPRASFVRQTAPRGIVRGSDGGRGCSQHQAGRAQRRPGRGLCRRHRLHPDGAVPAAAGCPDRHRPRLLDRALRADPDGGAVDPEAARLLGLPHRPADRHPAAARAQHRHHPPHPLQRRGGLHGGRPRHRRLRQLRHERRLRDRHHRVRDPDHRQFRGHHQGRHAHRRGRRPLHPRCHPRQADGDRRRPQRRPDRREGGDPPPPRARGGERLLRRHGRRLQVRARRRHRRPHHHRRQHLRRHRHRRDAPRHVAGRCRRRVHQALRRRRPRHADPRAHRLAGGRPAGVEGRHARLDREGGVRAARQLPARPAAGRRCHVRAGDGARPALRAVRAARLAAAASSPTPFPSAAAEVLAAEEAKVHDDRRWRPRRRRGTPSRTRSRPPRSSSASASRSRPRCSSRTASSPSASPRCAASSRASTASWCPRSSSPTISASRPRPTRSRSTARSSPARTLRIGDVLVITGDGPQARRARRRGARAGLRHEGHVGAGDVRRPTSSARASSRSTTCRCCSPTCAR